MSFRARTAALAMLGLPACGSDTGAPAKPHASSASTNDVPNEALLAVWADQPDDVWAVGDHGTIVHYDGHNWKTSKSGTTSQLSAVNGTGPDDVWAVGESGKILHYDGKAWSSSDDDPTTNLLGVWTSASDDVWIAGIATDSNEGYLRHFDGSAWEGLTIPTSTSLWEVWGTGADDVWMVGTTTQGTGLVLHGVPSQGPMGQPTTDFEAVPYDGDSLRAVWGTSTNDVWVAEYGGTIQRWDGSNWYADAAPATGLLGLWGSDATDLWAVGLSGAMVHGDGQAWSPAAGGTKLDLWSVSGTAADDVWAVGAKGTILHWDGKNWRSPLTSP